MQFPVCSSRKERRQDEGKSSKAKLYLGAGKPGKKDEWNVQKRAGGTNKDGGLTSKNGDFTSKMMVEESNMVL